MPIDRKLRGLAIFAMSVALFGCIDTSAKWLITAGLAPLVVVFARYAGHLMLILAVTLPTQGTAVLRSVSPRLQLARSACLFLSTLFNFLALRHLPLSLTTAILFSGPIFTTLLSIPLLGERVTPRRIAGVVLGFVGVLYIVQPWSENFSPAMILSIGSVLSVSMYFILTRRLSHEANATHQIWAGAVATLCLAPFILWQATWPERPMEWLIFALIGVFGLSSHSLAALAHRMAPASVLAPMIYLQLLFVSSLAYLVFGSVPGPEVLIGGAIIIAAGLWLRHVDRIETPATANPQPRG
ncbi:DMT family transporter [uncultured Paracoccus sp.]|uniref:DMT family transporter n=1 Tax=uncultured Paracoccus sp. TaxID=189685 RepID=UPI00261D800C|nr:DMT family transporter [uncultured Paracoccus sp.]